MKHPINEREQGGFRQNLKKGGVSNAWGTRNTLQTMGTLHVRKSFLDMLKSQM